MDSAPGGGALGYGRHLTRGNSSKVWKGGGDGRVHSSVVAPSPQGLPAALRPAKSVWKTMNTKNSVEAKEMKAPIDDTRVQPAKASGQSLLRRGMPARPRQCSGNKLRWTPTKHVQKWIL